MSQRPPQQNPALCPSSVPQPLERPTSAGGEAGRAGHRRNRFHSWTSPDPELVEDVAEQLAPSLRPGGAARATEPRPDHLRSWLAVRETVPWDEAPDGGGDEPVTPSHDSAAKDIRTFDHAVDPARAQGLLAALELLRADAARGALLDFQLLQRWQQHVLGTPQPPPFRDRPAFAKGGRERYGIGPDTRARPDACLAQSARDAGRPLPLTARAARAYLDPCFFHPFDDGNASSAFLTLVFVLAREGVALDDVSLLRRVTFQADDPHDALTLTRYIDIHLRETRSNTASLGSQERIDTRLSDYWMLHGVGDGVLRGRRRC
ncbi:hypothetical protein [Streptomyces sp. NPDC002573]|uniref:hypothetical protein n=1 Tax=Streptomyces sp. NPDC002573 TaxID=3364651 RepID=UPI0036B6ED0E